MHIAYVEIKQMYNYKENKQIKSINVYIVIYATVQALSSSSENIFLADWHKHNIQFRADYKYGNW